jgi:hypothetical protein
MPLTPEESSAGFASMQEQEVELDEGFETANLECPTKLPLQHGWRQKKRMEFRLRISQLFHEPHERQEG